jgi:hypothetical protein
MNQRWSRHVVWSALLVLGLWASSSRAESSVDLAANSAILERLLQVLPGLGLREPNIGGGAALSLITSAQHGTPARWNDIDVRAFPETPLTVERVYAIGRKISDQGWAEVLPPGPLEFSVYYPAAPLRLRDQGHGLRMKTSEGLRFDLALLKDRQQLALSGYNSAESMVIPLHGETDLHAIRARLARRPVGELVTRGELLDPHGTAADVIHGKLVLINRHFLHAEPELQALRFLRAIDKLGRYTRTHVDARRDLADLEKRLPTLIAHAPPPATDPSYLPRVQEQAAHLLADGDARLLATAKRMGLDVSALAAGKVHRGMPGR